VYCFERCTYPESDLVEGETFCQNLVHLFTLMHAVALQELREDMDMGHFCQTITEEHRDVQELTGNHPVLPVYGELQSDEAEMLEDAEDRVYAVMTWITHDWVVRKKQGGIRVPEPVLSRAFQSLSDGHQAFMQAKKIQETPFPYPYAQLVTMLLAINAVTAPLMVAAYVDDTLLAVSLSFIATIVSVSLDEVAKEIEDPYGFDANDLPLSNLHEEYLARIVQVMEQIPLRENILRGKQHKWYSKS